MKYIFRGFTVFEYIPNEQIVIEHNVPQLEPLKIPAFNYCIMIPEDYKLLAGFFDTVYRHINGEDVKLVDIVVN